MQPGESPRIAIPLERRQHGFCALIAGLLRRGVAPRQIAVGEPSADARAALQSEWAVHASADNAAAVADAGLVVLAVKPQDAGNALRALQPRLLDRKPVVLSIAAGLRIADLARACPAWAPR